MNTVWNRVTSTIRSSSLFDPAEIQSAFSSWGVNIPADYAEIQARTNGCRIRLGERHLRLYSLNEIGQIRSDYGLDRYVADALIFGSDGVGGVYCFDAGSEEPKLWEMAFVPFARQEAESRGHTLADLIMLIGDGVGLERLVAIEVPGSVRERHARTPLAHGGSATEPGNWVEIEVPSLQHAEICRFWNDVWISQQSLWYMGFGQGRT